jgi:hypothetical protein
MPFMMFTILGQTPLIQFVADINQRCFTLSTVDICTKMTKLYP